MLNTAGAACKPRLKIFKDPNEYEPIKDTGVLENLQYCKMAYKLTGSNTFVRRYHVLP